LAFDKERASITDRNDDARTMASMGRDVMEIVVDGVGNDIDIDDDVEEEEEEEEEEASRLEGVGGTRRGWSMDEVFIVPSPPSWSKSSKTSLSLCRCQ
jgi:hypothetical protein